MPDEKDLKKNPPLRFDVEQSHFSENITYDKGAYGTIKGEIFASNVAALGLPNRDNILIKEGSHVTITKFDVRSNLAEFLNYDTLTIDNPKRLPFSYMVAGDDTYVFLQDKGKIVSSAKLVDFTPGDSQFAKSTSGTQVNSPQEVSYKGAKRVDLINQLEELLTTGQIAEKPNRSLSVDEQKELMNLGHNLKKDEMRYETSLELEKAKRLFQLKHDPTPGRND